MTNNKDQTPEKNHKTDFSSGFVFGVLAGFTGYFLTKTDEGKQMRSKFTKEWKTTRKKLVKEGIVHDDHATVADFFQVVKAKIAEVVGEDFIVEQTVKNKKAKPKPKKKRATKRTSAKEKTAKKKKMFKGL